LLGRSTDQKLILRIRGHADAQFVVEFLRAIRRVLECYDAFPEFEAKLAQIRLEQDVVDKTTRRIEHIRDELATICMNTGVSVTAANLIDLLAEQIKTERMIPEVLESTEGSSSGTPSLIHDPRVAELARKAGKAMLARRTARARIEKFSGMLSAEELERHLEDRIAAFERLENVVAKFQRQLGYEISIERVSQFVRMSSKVLATAKKVITLIAAVKSGGASLLG
jgi:glycerol dehydrogenase-like iron-containing ADH family enzyme